LIYLIENILYPYTRGSLLFQFCYDLCSRSRIILALRNNRSFSSARARVSLHRALAMLRGNCVLESSAALFGDLVHPTPEPAARVLAEKTIDSIDVIVHSWSCTIGIRLLLTALNLRASYFPSTIASRSLLKFVVFCTYHTRNYLKSR